jgi:ElaB/YqjD/DUF883 family membrane-anchored ribosome-binding protein
MADKSAEKPSESKEVEELKEEIRRLREDISSITDKMANVVRAGARVGSSQAREELDYLQDRFGETYESVRREGGRAVAGIEREIEDRPFTAIAGALVVGLLLGKFLSDR